VRDIRPTLYLLQNSGGGGAAHWLREPGQPDAGAVERADEGVCHPPQSWGPAVEAGPAVCWTESVALALMGGALGIAVAYGGVRLLSYLGAKDLPRGATIGIDSGALAFTAAIAPADRHGVRRRAPGPRAPAGSERGIPRQRAHGDGRARRSVVRSTLVVCQFAFAFVLLMERGCSP